MPDFKTADDRTAYIIANADYFTCVRRKASVGTGYERHEVPTLERAEELARELANAAQKPYMIYAVCGIHDTYVKGIVHEQRQQKA